MLLLKVGKKEHLELLRKGHIHFNPLSLFRNDGTNYRGDALEGTYRIDTSRGIFINGVDISKIGEGMEVTMTYQHSDDILIFCGAILDDSTSVKVVNDSGLTDVQFRPEFLKEIKQFGQYAVGFESKHFVKAVEAALKDKQCNYGYSKVAYIDKWDFEAVSTYLNRTNENLGDEATYFLKDATYKAQNEWRFIIDCIENVSAITKNSDGSLTLNVTPFPTTEVFELG